MRPLSSSPSKAAGPICRARLRKRGGTGRHPGPYQDNIPVLVARDRKGATLDAVLPQADGAAIAAVLRGVVTPANHLVGDGGKPLAAFARRAGIPFHGPCLRRESPPPTRPTCTSTTSTPTTAASSNGSTASTASPPRTCPTISVGGALSKPGASKSIRQAGSTAQSETDHTNRYRYKSPIVVSADSFYSLNPKAARWSPFCN
jgi:hypothetical protein